MAETIVHQRLVESLNTRNIIDNGGFEVWQKGISSGVIAQGAYCDKWDMIRNAVSVQMDRITGASGNGYAFDCYSSTVPTPGVGYMYIEQVIENFEQYKGKTITVSFKMKVVRPGADNCRFFFWDGIAASTTITITNTSWQSFTKTFTVSPSATTLYMTFGYSGLGHLVSSGAHFMVDDVMLVIGANTPEFVPTPLAEDLMRCERYYCYNEKLYFAGNLGVTFGCSVPVSFPTTMAATPTITKNTTGWIFVNTNLSNVTIPFDQHNRGFSLYMNPLGNGQTTARHLTKPWTAEVT